MKGGEAEKPRKGEEQKLKKQGKDTERKYKERVNGRIKRKEGENKKLDGERNDCKNRLKRKVGR